MYTLSLMKSSNWVRYKLWLRETSPKTGKKDLIPLTTAEMELLIRKLDINNQREEENPKEGYL